MSKHYAGGHETHEGKQNARNQETFVYNELESQPQATKWERLEVLIPIALKENNLPEKIRSIMTDVLNRIQTPYNPNPTDKQYQAIFSFLKSYQAAGILNAYQIIQYEARQQSDNDIIDTLKMQVAELLKRVAQLEAAVYHSQTEKIDELFF